MIPNALFAVLFCNVFLIASAVCLSSLMVRDALHLVNDFGVRITLQENLTRPFAKIAMTQTVTH